MIFISCAFIPWIITNKKLRIILTAHISKLFYLCCSSGKITEQVELVALIKTKRGPCWPYADNIIAAIKFLTAINKFFQMKLLILSIIKKFVPGHHKMMHISLTNPL